MSGTVPNDVILNTYELPPGVRLDHFLTEQLGEEFSRSRIQKLIESGAVKADGLPLVKSSLQVKEPRIIQVQLPEEPPPAKLEPRDLKFPILFQDNSLAVIHKPPGITVHPGIGTGDDTLVHGLLAAFKQLAPGFAADRPGIVHRLDRETEGVMVIAKNARAHAKLSAQFQERTVKKIYSAIVWGELRAPEKRVSGTIRRHPKERRKMFFEEFPALTEESQMTEEDLLYMIPENARSAALRYKVIAERSSFSWLEIELETGRTHQIRATFAALGNPVAGDSMYGDERRLAKRFNTGKRKLAALHECKMALAAIQLGFTHPETNKPVSFRIDLPERFHKFWEGLKSKAD